MVRARRDCVLQDYGLTEAMPVVTRRRRSRTRTGCGPRRAAGRTLPGADRRGRRRAGRGGEVGEVLVQGPTVMRVLANPEATARGVPRGRLAAHGRRRVPR